MSNESLAVLLGGTLALGGEGIFTGKLAAHADKSRALEAAPKISGASERFTINWFEAKTGTEKSALPNSLVFVDGKPVTFTEEPLVSVRGKAIENGGVAKDAAGNQVGIWKWLYKGEQEKHRIELQVEGQPKSHEVTSTNQDLYHVHNFRTSQQEALTAR